MKKLFVLMPFLLMACTHTDEFFHHDDSQRVIGKCPNGSGGCVTVTFIIGKEPDTKKTSG